MPSKKEPIEMMKSQVYGVGPRGLAKQFMEELHMASYHHLAERFCNQVRRYHTLNLKAKRLRYLEVDIGSVNSINEFTDEGLVVFIPQNPKETPTTYLFLDLKSDFHDAVENEEPVRLSILLTGPGHSEESLLREGSYVTHNRVILGDQPTHWQALGVELLRKAVDRMAYLFESSRHEVTHRSSTVRMYEDITDKLRAMSEEGDGPLLKMAHHYGHALQTFLNSEHSVEDASRYTKDILQIMIDVMEEHFPKK